jgi:hypothetical protein
MLLWQIYVPGKEKVRTSSCKVPCAALKEKDIRLVITVFP